MFVPRCGRRRLIASSACLRSSLGGATSAPKSLNDTTPIFTPSGWFSTNSRAASFVASMRFGSTSSANIEPDTSIERMIVPVFEGTGIVACGRASPMISAIIASR